VHWAKDSRATSAAVTYNSKSTSLPVCLQFYCCSSTTFRLHTVPATLSFDPKKKKPPQTSGKRRHVNINNNVTTIIVSIDSPNTTATPKPNRPNRSPPPNNHRMPQPPFLHQTTNLINAAYSAPATTLLKPHRSRTNIKEIRTWLESGNFYLAFACDPSSSSSNNDNPYQPQASIGTIRLTPLSPSISEIGILTVDTAFRSSGLGRTLIAYAEDLAMKDGVERVRIEVPSPRISSSDEAGAQVRVTSGKKKYLRRWYESLGYELVRKRTLEEAVPGLIEAFEEDVEILVMEKMLGGG
jgi:GNAT superfamily N-acetyltransferase